MQEDNLSEETWYKSFNENAEPFYGVKEGSVPIETV